MTNFVARPFLSVASATHRRHPGNSVQIGWALQDYEMLTKQELALWTKDLERSREQNGRSQDAGQGERNANTTDAS